MLNFDQPETPRHEMKVIKTFESGAVECYCEQCGRHDIWIFHPRPKKIPLAEGNWHALHSMTMGCLSFTGMNIIDEKNSPDGVDVPDSVKEYLNSDEFKRLWGEIGDESSD